jgi:organic radical activating enzyme
MNNKANIIFPLRESFLDYLTNFDDLCISVFMTGCHGSCKGCHNKELWAFENKNAKSLTPTEFLLELQKYSIKYRTNLVSIMGGDPLYKSNLPFLKELLELKSKFKFFIYTGYDIEYVKSNNLKGFDYIKTGKYDENKKQIVEKKDDYFSLASINQEVYDKDFNLLTKKGVYGL